MGLLRILPVVSWVLHELQEQYARELKPFGVLLVERANRHAQKQGRPQKTYLLFKIDFASAYIARSHRKSLVCRSQC